MHYKVQQRIEAVQSGKTTTLELGGFDLTELPEEVYALKRLKVLRVRNLLLASNQSLIDLFKKYPPEDGDLLAELQEEEQELKNDLLIPRQLLRIDDRIGKLRSLEVIDFSYNRIETLPESIGQLHSLRHLVLYSNLITKLPESLTTLLSLHGLDIRDNPIQSLPPFPHLKRYEVYRNHFMSQRNEAGRGKDFSLAAWFQEQAMKYGLAK